MRPEQTKKMPFHAISNTEYVIWARIVAKKNDEWIKYSHPNPDTLDGSNHS